MVTKICVGDYVGDIYHNAKFYPNRFRGFFSSYTRNIHPSCSLRYPIRMFTTFFGSSNRDTAETPAWILALKTSNDAVLRKEVPFDGYKSEISYLTEF